MFKLKIARIHKYTIQAHYYNILRHFSNFRKKQRKSSLNDFLLASVQLLHINYQQIVKEGGSLQKGQSSAKGLNFSFELEYTHTHTHTYIYTHKSRAHVKSRVLGVHYRHIAQRDMKSVPEYRDLKLCFELRLVEARERRACVRWLEMSGR